MKKLIFAFLILAGVSMANAWDVPGNPDRYVSVGLNASSLKLKGDINTDLLLSADTIHQKTGAYGLDVRIPIHRSVTLSAFGNYVQSQNDIDTVSQKGTGYQYGVSLRFYAN